jgi:exodeoxyribonuclease-3
MMRTQDWVDLPRQFVPSDQKLYSWWSYRNRDWRLSNRGRRLDHVLVSPVLKDSIKSHAILTDARDWERGSDHVPVLATLNV